MEVRLLSAGREVRGTMNENHYTRGMTELTFEHEGRTRSVWVRSDLADTPEKEEKQIKLAKLLIENYEPCEECGI